MNGQPISGLNSPTANDQAANMGFVNQQVRKAAHRNLLDNSDFRNPVNQRGQTSYSGARIYTIDRWMAGSSSTIGSCSLIDDGINFTNTDTCDFEQLLENYDKMKGKRFTIAYKDCSGGVYCVPFTMGGCQGVVLGQCEFYSVEGRHVLFRFNAGVSVTVAWVALYEGEYTIDTLPEYQPKGYGAELAECQRYANVLEVSSFGRVGLCKSSAGEAASVLFVDTPVMRSGAVPSVSLISGSWSDLKTEFGVQTVTSISGFAYQVSTKHNLLVNLSGNNPTQTVEPLINTATNVVKILISLDL
jgi:hypothetical protein